MISKENKIWVKIDKSQKMTSSGLFIPNEGILGAVREGVVTAVGPGRLTPNGREPCNVKVGDRVLVSCTTGYFLEVQRYPRDENGKKDVENPETYYVLPDTEVLCVVETDKESFEDTETIDALEKAAEEFKKFELPAMKN